MDQAQSNKPKGVIRFRYVFSVLCMICMTINSLLRINYTISTALHLQKAGMERSLAMGFGRSVAGYFIGSALIALPAGRLSELYSAKWILFICTLFFATTHIVNPFILNTASVPAIIAIKVLDGLASGAITPSMVVLLARWSPPSERFVMCGITFCGTYLGAAVGYFVIKCLPQEVGLESRFLLAASFAFVYLVFHVIYVEDHPQYNTGMSKEEQHYIVSSLNDQIYEPSLKRKSLIPWKSMFKSGPFLSLFTVHSAIQLVNSVTINRYVADMRDLQWKEGMNNFTKAIVMCSAWFWGAVVALTLGILFSTLHHQDAITKKTAVKIATTMGLLMPVIVFPIDFFFGKDWKLTVKPLMYITLAGITNMVQANHIELAPNYAGTLLGITTALGHVVEGVVHGFYKRYEKRMTLIVLYCITAFLGLVGMIIYNIFLSCEVQPWNHHLKKDAIKTKQNIAAALLSMIGLSRFFGESTTK